MKIGVKSPLKRRRTPPTGPGVRQLHQRRLEKSRVRGGPRQGPAPDRPLRLALGPKLRFVRPSLPVGLLAPPAAGSG